VLDYEDASTNQNFTSWPNFLDRHADHGDFFSKVQQCNLSSSLFDEVATGGYLEDETSPAGIVIYGYGNRSATMPAPFATEDIVILTDSVCHSACAAFVEMMHHEAGVRTVVVGGWPNVGPMQAVAGTRGALAYSTDQLDNDMYVATTFNSSVTDELLQSKIFVSGLHLRGSISETKSVKARQNISLNSSHMKLPTAGFTGPIQHLTISGTYGSMPPMQRGQNQTCASKIRGTFTPRMRQILSVPAQARKFCGAVPNLDNGRTPVLPLEPATETQRAMA
jgi:hypothetical protein